ncbi:MAG: hypothetical protein DCC65_06145 [Planctomycetota bacterium]|nr:MAG: hypothetical protein DCC65_06145 [Planctomycetota bacterium]
MTPNTHRRILARPALIGAVVAPIVAALFAAAPRAAAQPDGPESPPHAGRPDDEGDRPRFGERFRRARERWRDRRETGPRDDLPVPPELADDIMKMVKEKFPERYDRLAALKEKNPRRFEMMIKRMAPVAIEYFKLREEAPELAETIIREFKNQERLHELSRQYQAAKNDPARQAELEQEITDLVRAQDQFLQQRVAFRLKDFEERLRRQQAWLELQRARMEREKSRSEERVADRVARIKLGDVAPPELPIGPLGPGAPGDRPGHDRFRGPRGRGGFGEQGPDEGPLPAGRPARPRHRGRGAENPPPRDGADHEAPPPPEHEPPPTPD